MEQITAKQIIFRANELSSKDCRGWIPCSKPIKMCILDYLKQNNKRPNATASLVNETFSILADLENYYAEKNKLEDGYFYQLPKAFEEEWGVKPDTVNSTTEVLVNMGWISKDVRGAYDYVNKSPIYVPYYKFNHEKIFADISKKYNPKLISI